MKLQSPDWEKARSLYESRASHALIVKEANVTFAALRKRISRERWSTTRTEAREIVEGQNLQQKSERLRAAIVDECLEDVAIVKQSPPRTMSHSEKRQALLSRIADNGSKAGAWQNNQPSSCILRLEVMAACRPPDPIQPAIDVPAIEAPATNDSAEAGIGHVTQQE